MLDYRPYLGSSFAVEVAPGQLLYWPQTYYHVGESDLGPAGQPATSVNVGIRREEHRAEYDLQDFLSDPTPEPASDDPALVAPEAAGLLVPPEHAGADLDRRLPAPLARSLDSLRSECEPRVARYRSAVLALRTGDMVRAEAPIRWAQVDQARLCAANGHVTSTSVPAERLAGLVARLRSGERLPVAGLAADERRLLAVLETFRALNRSEGNLKQ